MTTPSVDVQYRSVLTNEQIEALSKSELTRLKATHPSWTPPADCQIMGVRAFIMGVDLGENIAHLQDLALAIDSKAEAIGRIVDANETLCDCANKALDTRVNELAAILTKNQANSQESIADSTARIVTLEQENRTLRQEMAAMRMLMNQMSDRLTAAEHGIVHRNDDAVSVNSALPSVIGGGSEAHDSDTESDLDDRLEQALGNPQA